MTANDARYAMMTVSEEDLVDNVNHPKHYEGKTSLECIECMRLIFGVRATHHFCFGNAFKYLWRYKHKNGYEDIKKARWYLDYVLEDINNREYNDKEITKETEDMYEKLNDLYNQIINKIDQ